MRIKIIQAQYILQKLFDIYPSRWCFKRPSVEKFSGFLKVAGNVLFF